MILANGDRKGLINWIIGETEDDCQLFDMVTSIIDDEILITIRNISTNEIATFRYPVVLFDMGGS